MYSDRRLSVRIRCRPFAVTAVSVAESPQRGSAAIIPRTTRVRKRKTSSSVPVYPFPLKEDPPCRTEGPAIRPLQAAPIGQRSPRVEQLRCFLRWFFFLFFVVCCFFLLV